MTDLHSEVQRDTHRVREFLRNRDEHRAQQDHAPANTTPRRLVSTADLQNGDMDQAGDLVEPGAYVVWGWKTNSTEEEGCRIDADTPAAAGRALARLLREGHVQFTASRLGRDGLVAFPS